MTDGDLLGEPTFGSVDEALQWFRTQLGTSRAEIKDLHDRLHEMRERIYQLLTC